MRWFCFGRQAPAPSQAQGCPCVEFSSTFAYGEGVRQHGPTWPLKGDAPGATGITTPELSAAVGA